MSSTKTQGTWPGHLPTVSDAELLIIVAAIPELGELEAVTVTALCDGAKVGEKLSKQDRDWLVAVAKHYDRMPKKVTPSKRREPMVYDDASAYSVRRTDGTARAESIVAAGTARDADGNLLIKPPRRVA